MLVPSESIGQTVEGPTLCAGRVTSRLHDRRCKYPGYQLVSPWRFFCSNKLLVSIVTWVPDDTSTSPQPNFFILIVLTRTHFRSYHRRRVVQFVSNGTPKNNANSTSTTTGKGRCSTKQEHSCPSEMGRDVLQPEASEDVFLGRERSWHPKARIREKQPVLAEFQIHRPLCVGSHCPRRSGTKIRPHAHRHTKQQVLSDQSALFELFSSIQEIK